MEKYTLLISMLFALVVALIYAYVGSQLGRRRFFSAEAQFAWRLFAVWWYGLAATTFISGLLGLLGAFGLMSLPLMITFTYVNILVICLALWGLLYYLIYLFTGSKSLLPPLTLFYIGYYIVLQYYIVASNPNGVAVNRWNIQLVYETPLTGPFFTLVLILLIFPQILGSLAYFSLYFKAKEATQKYRISLVSWSIIIWFGSSFLVSITGLSNQDWWQIVSRFMGLAAALTIYIAYFPPNWIKQRYNILAITDQPAS